jgi:hypothetical protein
LCDGVRGVLPGPPRVTVPQARTCGTMAVTAGLAARRSIARLVEGSKNRSRNRRSVRAFFAAPVRVASPRRPDVTCSARRRPRPSRRRVRSDVRARLGTRVTSLRPRRARGGEPVPDDMLRYADETAHRPNAGAVTVGRPAVDLAARDHACRRSPAVHDDCGISRDRDGISRRSRVDAGHDVGRVHPPSAVPGRVSAPYTARAVRP